MAVTTGNQPRTNARNDGLEPYYKRLEPIDGGYTLTRASGQQLGEIRIFDDRDADGVIHTQFCVGRGRATKVATFHCESLAEYQDVIEALTLGALALTP